MSKISATDVQKLRMESGAGMMECKKALEEAGGDYTKALAVIKERGLAKVEKRAERDTGAGVIMSYVHSNRIGALLDIRAETDFVVRSEPFQALAKEVVMQVAAMNPADVPELLAQPSIRDASRTIEDLVKEVIAKVGENIRIKSIARLEL